MSDFVSWRNSYSIGIRVIDDQHKYLLNLTNHLYEACTFNDGLIGEKFKTTIQSAIEYVGVHFSTEEKLMERTNYPGIAAHKQAHKIFVQKVLESVKEFEEGKVYTPNAFVRFLRDWVLEHIAMEDKKMGEYFLRLKQQGKLHS